MEWIAVLELLREEHAMLAFDGLIMTVDEAEAGLIAHNPTAFYFHLPSTILLASSVH